MTDQEKAALLALCGTVHAQAKLTDNMIVQGSGNLKPISTNIQQKFEQVYHIPSQNGNRPAQQPPQPAPVYNTVTPEQAAQELQQLELPLTAPPPNFVDINSLPVAETVNLSNIESSLKEISLALDRIANILTKEKDDQKKNKTKNYSIRPVSV